MSINSAYLRRAAQMGLTLEQAAELAEIIEAGFAQPVPNYVPSSAAQRQKKYRDKRNGVTENVTQTITRDVTRDVTGDVTHPVTVTVPHVRGENNLSKLVDKPNLTTLNASDAPEPDLDWPSEAKPSRAYLDRLEAALRATAGEALDPTATKLFSLAPILALGRNGAGPPCDVQADVLPTIRARSARAPPRSVRSWDFYTDAIREARDRRLIGAPETRPVNQGLRHDRPDQPSAKLAAKQANMERSLRGAEIVLARRAI